MEKYKALKSLINVYSDGDERDKYSTSSTPWIAKSYQDVVEGVDVIWSDLVMYSCDQSSDARWVGTVYLSTGDVTLDIRPIICLVDFQEG